MIVNGSQDPSDRAAHRPAQVDGKAIQRIRTDPVLLPAIMSNCSRIGGPERFIDQAQQKSGPADERIAFHLPQDHKKKAAAGQGDQLYPVKTDPVRKPSTQEPAADSAQSKYTHHQSRLGNTIPHGWLCEIDRHEGDHHRTAAVDQHDE